MDFEANAKKLTAPLYLELDCVIAEYHEARTADALRRAYEAGAADALVKRIDAAAGDAWVAVSKEGDHD